MAFPTGWSRRAPLIIQSSLVPALLTNFPLLLTKNTLPSEMFDADGTYPAQNGGGDLRFSTDAAGTNQIPCEVLSFVTNNDPALGSAEIWVKVPSVSASVDTTIYVWYNTAGTDSQPAVTDIYGRDAVWSDYEAVWHLGTSSSLVDSTGNSHTLSLAAGPGATNSVFSNGLSALDFADDTAYTIAGDWGTLFDGAADYTITCWAKSDDPPDNSQSNAWIGNDIITFRPIADIWLSYHTDIEDSNIDKIAFHAYNSLNTPVWEHVGQAASIATEYYVVAGYDNTAGDMFLGLNQVARSTNAIYDPTLDIGTGDNVIGSSSTLNMGVRTWDGLIGEMLVYPGVLSKDWTDAIYSNQNAPATFVIEGTPVTLGSPIITNVIDGIDSIFSVGQLGVFILGTGFGTIDSLGALWAADAWDEEAFDYDSW